ncbi:MAG: biotin synthase, partial [Gallionella sp.]
MTSQSIQFTHPVPTPPQRWSVAAVEELFKLPFADLLFQAQQVHRAHFDPNQVQLS